MSYEISEDYKKIQDEQEEYVKSQIPDDLTISPEVWHDLEVGRNNKYTIDQRVQAVCYYAVLGNSLKVERLLGIPASTIRHWRGMDWWPIVISEVRKAKDQELDAMLTDVMHKATEQLLDRVENGDEVVTKDGDIVRKKLGAKDLAVAGLAVPYDKRALMRGDPTSRVEKKSSDEILTGIATQLEAVLDKVETKLNIEPPITVDGEFEEIMDVG